jgi:hypothetical protein
MNKYTLFPEKNKMEMDNGYCHETNIWCVTFFHVKTIFKGKLGDRYAIFVIFFLDL